MTEMVEMIGWTLLFLIGFIAATFGSIVGIGGGIIIVPSLLFVSSLGVLNRSIEPQNAVGISLLVIILTAISATLYNYKQNRVDIKSALTFFMASGPAAIIGSMINKYIKVNQFYILFGLLMVFITYFMARRNKLKPKKINWHVTREYIDNKGIRYKYGYNRYAGFFIPAFAGIISGLFGIGGGSILVPVMIVLFNFPPHVATATSLFFIMLSASLGSISHILLGHVIFQDVLIVGIGAFVGGRIGSYISSKMSSNALILTLRIVIILIAFQMIYKGLSV